MTWPLGRLRAVFVYFNLGGRRKRQNMATVSAPNQINREVRDFLSKPRKMLIGGQWVEAVSQDTFATLDPATGEVLAQVAKGEAADIDRAVKAARAAFDSGPWPEILPAERSRLLWRLSDLIEQHKEELAELETLDNGKPLLFSRKIDVPSSVNTFRYISPTPCANRWALSDRSSPGIFL